jgi:hypothetical protein
MMICSSNCSRNDFLRSSKEQGGGEAAAEAEKKGYISPNLSHSLWAAEEEAKS